MACPIPVLFLRPLAFSCEVLNIVRFIYAKEFLSIWLMKRAVPGFFLCLSFASPFIQAQDSQKMAFSKIENGLFNEWISSITQDSLGFIWVGTQDGLHRYDGYKFEVIRNSPEELNSPAANWIQDIAIDNKSNYWLGTFGGGLSKFSAKDMTFQNFETDSLLPSQGKQVYKVAMVSEHQVLSVSDEGFHLYDSDTNKSTNLGIGGLLSSMTKQGNDIWLSDDSKLYFYSIDNQTINHFKTFGSAIYFLHYIPELGTLVGFEKRLLLYDAQKLLKEMHIDETIFFHTSDDKGDYYMASRTKLFKLDYSSLEITELPIDIDFRNKQIESIFLDRQGSLWIGTNKGLFKEKKYSPSFLPEPIDLHARTILKHGEPWYIGGLGGLYSVYEGQISSIINNKPIQSLINVGDTVLASTYQTDVIKLLKNQPLDTLTLPLKPNTEKGIFGIVTDQRGRLWMGTWEGLYVYDHKKQDFKTASLDSDNNLGKIQIVNMHLDKKDRLWVFTSGNGMFKIENLSNSLIETDAPKIINYKNIKGDNNSLTSNIIITAEEDDQDQLWFGTDIGVVKYIEETDNFSRLQYQGKLFDKKIMMVVKDDRQNLWITTINDGIYVYNKTEETMRHFTVNDGLISNAFLFGSGFFDEKSRTMFFGTDSGVQQIDLSKPLDQEISTYPVITNFQVSNTSVNNSFRPSQIPFLKNIALEAAQNDFSVSFSGMDFIAPEKVGFSYTLDNNTWRKTDLQTAYFTNVPYGKHTLKVKSLYDGIPNNKNISSLEIYIAPPWYLSKIAKIIYVLLFFTALWGIYYYLKWRWRMQLNLQLKEEEADRLQKLNDFKSNLYTDIAHEFKTPLTLISGPIDQKLSQGSLSDFDHANFSIVKRNTHRLTSLVDQLLELAKLEDGKLKLQVKKGDLALFMHTICQSFEYQAYIKDISYSVEITDTGEVWYDEDIIEKITTNLLSNAFKYTPKAGVCIPSFKNDGHFGHFSIKNTAVNASKLELEKLFTRFYQHDQYAEGMGIGLSLVQELVTFYGGTIDARMEQNDIIHFEVKLPIERSAFPIEAVIEESQNIAPIAGPVDIIDIVENFNGHPNEELPILLIVEDHQEVRTFIKLALQRNYRILEAENGKTGLEIALSQIPDIILSDIRMPIKNGIQLCNVLKTDERTSHIPIILLTASVGEEDELKGLTSGADDFVRKPFKINVLEQRIANLVAIRRSLRNRYSQELILKPKDILINTADEIFLDKVQHILDDNLSNPEFNSEAFSKKVKMSRMQLHRKLLAYTGLSTSAFIRSQRLKQAVEILKTTDLTINEVAYMVGFNTPSYFMTCFKETYKKTPSEYLQSIK